MGNEKKKENDIHSSPLIYLLHQCVQIGLRIGNELGPRLRHMCRESRRVCHPQRHLIEEQLNTHRRLFLPRAIGLERLVVIAAQHVLLCEM